MAAKEAVEVEVMAGGQHRSLINYNNNSKDGNYNEYATQKSNL